MRGDLLGWAFDYRYTLAHISRFTEVEGDGESAWCRVTPLCRGVYGRNSTVRRDYLRPLGDLVSSDPPLRNTWTVCPKCHKLAAARADS